MRLGGGSQAQRSVFQRPSMLFPKRVYPPGLLSDAHFAARPREKSESSLQVPPYTSVTSACLFVSVFSKKRVFVPMKRPSRMHGVITSGVYSLPRECSPTNGN